MLSLAKFIKKEIQLRENLVGTGFLDPPGAKKTDKNQGDVRVTCIGEIVETVGFNAEQTYVFFDTFVPEGWTFEDFNAYETLEPVRDEHAENNKR
jgi:hypothetical protein